MGCYGHLRWVGKALVVCAVVVVGCALLGNLAWLWAWKLGLLPPDWPTPIGWIPSWLVFVMIPMCLVWTIRNHAAFRRSLSKGEYTTLAGCVFWLIATVIIALLLWIWLT